MSSHPLSAPLALDCLETAVGLVRWVLADAPDSTLIALVEAGGGGGIAATTDGPADAWAAERFADRLLAPFADPGAAPEPPSHASPSDQARRTGAGTRVVLAAIRPDGADTPEEDDIDAWRRLKARFCRSPVELCDLLVITGHGVRSLAVTAGFRTPWHRLRADRRG